METKNIMIAGVGGQGTLLASKLLGGLLLGKGFDRSEERRVGIECRSRWSTYH